MFVIFPSINEIRNRAKKLLEKPAPLYDENLLTMIKETCDEINMCRKNLAYTNDKTLTDMYIHSLIASEMKYKHLMNIAKNQYESHCG